MFPLFPKNGICFIISNRFCVKMRKYICITMKITRASALLKTRKISFDLPQRYRLIDGDDSDPAFAGFNEELKPELVYCSLQEAIDDETAEDYVLDELVEDEACPEELRTRAYLKHEVIEGRLYYYYIFKYKKSRKQRQKFAAACDIGGGLFYTIETEWIWRKEELTLEALIDFLKIRVE